MKQNILLVGGGDSFSNREDFLKYLKSRGMWDLPSENSGKSWKQWVREELGEGYFFDTPNMPNKDNAHYDEWKIWFERHLEVAEGPVILIGLSLGAMFLVKYLIENDLTHEVKALFLLAGPCGGFDGDDGNDCAEFSFSESDLPRIVEKVGEIHIFHSTDDFVVPYSHAERYKAALPKAALHTFTDKNHFLIEEFPELIEEIRKLG